MKSIRVILIIFLLVFIPITVSAHPGGTDSNGGHKCRTNCERWGYQYGEYHYHGNRINVSYDNNKNYPTSNNRTSESIGDYIWFGIVILLAGIFIGVIASDKRR